MALFSEDLFNVFEETEKPSPAKSKKRKRGDQKANKDDANTSEDLKKVRVESTKGDGQGTVDVSKAEAGANKSVEVMDDSKGVEVNQAIDSEMAMDSETTPLVPKKAPPMFSEPAQIQTVDTVEGLICTHEVAIPPGYSYEALKPRSGPPAKEYPFVLDPFQRESLRCLENYQSVLVSAHTSAGKTVVAEYAIAMSLRDTQRVIYTTPIKALSNQKYREMQEQFQDVGLMTGDVTINPSASCIVMTTEILRSMLYRGSEVMREVGWVIFDEIHYMRDPERGVVWEETIILLPDNVHYVFLSATIPNARQFAEWICHLHKQPCHVVYTEFRPTPLQHYIYPAGADGLYLVVDEKGNFREDNFQQAMSKLGAGAREAGGRGKKGGQRGSNCFKVVKMIMERQLQPVIVFSFSRRDCEAYALQMSKLDFNTSDEKALVEEVFTNAIDCLSDDDKKLPQVEHVLPLLKRGIGIHHSGLLPILKETTEILFQEGLIKALFATETFALGLNMPARTVVFTNARKFDGKDFRWITSGEYIQMSGRAGRRGIDDRGIVMLMIDEQMDSTVGKNLLRGQPDPLNSAFHLTYNMVLNLLRVEEINPEYMLERSFYQFQNNSAIPVKQKKVKELEVKRDAIVIEDEEKVTNYYRIRQQLQKLEREMQTHITKPIYCVPFLQPGRLVKVEHNDEDFGWGAVVNFQKKANQKIAVETIYVAEVLLCCSTESCRNAPRSPPHPPPPGDKGEMQVVPIIINHLTKLSSVRLYLPKDIRSSDAKHSVRKSIGEVEKRFPDGLPLLDPVKDMKIKSQEFKELVKKVTALENRLIASPVHKHSQLEKLHNLCDKKALLNAEISVAKKDLKRAQTIMQMDELKCRKRVLRRLGYASASDVIEVKGRVACEISTGDELLLTELIFSGAFNNLSVEQATALLSCFVFQEKADATPKLTEELSGPLKMMQDSARRIARIAIESKLDLEEENYVESFRPHLMDVVHAWSSGAAFSHICKMTDVFEGSIIRCMRRLEELLRQMCQAAKAIGNTELENKFAGGIVKIKRDIVFAASLYL